MVDSCAFSNAIRLIVFFIFQCILFLSEYDWSKGYLSFVRRCRRLRPWRRCFCRKPLTFSSILFSRTIGSISSKLGTKHSLVKGIQVCSNEDARPSPREDNYEIAKIHLLLQNHWANFNQTWHILGCRGFKFFSSEGPALFQEVT